MGRGLQRSDKKHGDNKHRRQTTPGIVEDKPWGGQTPIITGPIGLTKHTYVASNDILRRNHGTNSGGEDARMPAGRDATGARKAEKTRRAA